jgi:hypothetical protein
MKAIRIRRTSAVLHHAKELAIGLALGTAWVAGAVGVLSIVVLPIVKFLR